MSSSNLSSPRSSITPPPSGLTSQRPRRRPRSARLSAAVPRRDLNDEERAMRGLQVEIRPYNRTLGSTWSNILKQGRMLLIVRVSAGNAEKPSIWSFYDVLHKTGNTCTIVTVPVESPGHANTLAQVQANAQRGEQSFLDGSVSVTVGALRSTRVPKSACLYIYSMNAANYTVSISKPRLPDPAALTSVTSAGISGNVRARLSSPSSVNTIIGCRVYAKEGGGMLADLFRGQSKLIFIMLEDQHQAFIVKGFTAANETCALERRVCPVPLGLVKHVGAVYVQISGVKGGAEMPAFVYK